MSTVIHNAYRLHPNVDLFAFRRELLGLESAMVRKAYQKALENAIRDWDWAVSRGEAASLRGSLVKEFKHQTEDDQNPMRHTSAVVIQNPVRGELYIMCYGALQGEQQMVLALPSVAEEFNYWNNTDGPEDMTPEEWADRKQAWDEALDRPYDSVSLQGLTISLLSPIQWHLNLKDCMDVFGELVQPSMEHRAENVAQQQYATDAQGDLQGQEGFMAFIRPYTDWRIAPEKVPNRETYLVAARKVITAQPSIEDELV